MVHFDGPDIVLRPLSTGSRDPGRRPVESDVRPRHGVHVCPLDATAHPPGVTAVSCGLTLAQNGELVTDDYSLIAGVP